MLVIRTVLIDGGSGAEGSNQIGHAAVVTTEEERELRVRAVGHCCEHAGMARQRCAMAEKRAPAKLKASSREQLTVAEQCLPEGIGHRRVLMDRPPACTTRTVAPSAVAVHDYRIIRRPRAVAPIEDQMSIATNEVLAQADLLGRGG